MTRRASVVAFDGDRVLLMLRRKQGSNYATLVGGKVEPGETDEQAALRELAEEASLSAVVLRRLPDVIPGEQSAFLVACHGEPILGGPEAEKANPWNRYWPMWVPLADLECLDLRPAPAMAIVLAAKEN